MKKFLGIIAVALIGMAATSCLNSDSYLYIDTGMCFVKDGALVTDSGITYVVTENATTGDYTKCERMVYSGYALEKISDNMYSFKLTDYCGAVYKECVVKGEGDEEELGSNPVSVAGMWYGGDCLNMKVDFLYVSNVGATHTFNLEYDSIKSNADTVYLSLRHNAHEEGDMEKYASVASGVYTYCSFPCSYFFQDGRTTVTVAVNFNWFKETCTSYLEDTVDYTVYQDLDKEDF